VLSSCYFPGNIRELENCVRRTATLAQGTRIVADDFACRHDECMSAVLWKSSEVLPPVVPRTARGEYKPAAVRPGEPSQPARAGCAGCEKPASNGAGAPAIERSAEQPEAERERLMEAMETAGWVQAKAARLLGLSARQIGYALRKHGISVKKF